MSVSYNRVIEIEDDITKQLCFHYNSQGVVCSPTLKHGLFTVAAIANIDHDPSSSTSQTSFHGTSISIFQYPEENEIMPKFEVDTTFSTHENHTPGFCQLRMLNLSLLIEKNTKSILTLLVHRTELKNRLQISNNWMDLRGDGNDNDRVSFASFFAKKSCHKMP